MVQYLVASKKKRVCAAWWRGAKDDLIAYNYFGGFTKITESNCSVGVDTITRGKLQLGRFRLNIRKNLFPGKDTAALVTHRHCEVSILFKT